MQLQTAQLLLREWREADRAPFAALNADPFVMAHLPAPLDRAGSDAFVERIRDHVAAHGYGLWALESDAGFVGFCGLAWTDVLGGRDLEVGWRLARSAWGRGYATEAARAAVEVGLRHAAEVVSFTALCNERSERVMVRLGMRRVREFDHPRADLPERLRRHVLYATP